MGNFTILLGSRGYFYHNFVISLMEKYLKQNLSIYKYWNIKILSSLEAKITFVWIFYTLEKCA